GEPRKSTDEYRDASRDERTAGEVGPAHMPWEPAWHQRGGSFDIGEVGVAERDQANAVENAGDAHALVTYGETDTLPVPVGREPREEHPRAGRHHHCVRETPGTFDQRREEERAHSLHQQPKHERGEQHTSS